MKSSRSFIFLELKWSMKPPSKMTKTSFGLRLKSQASKRLSRPKRSSKKGPRSARCPRLNSGLGKDSLISNWILWEVMYTARWFTTIWKFNPLRNTNVFKIENCTPMTRLTMRISRKEIFVSWFFLKTFAIWAMLKKISMREMQG